MEFLERVVVKRSQARHPEVFRRGIARGTDPLRPRHRFSWCTEAATASFPSRRRARSSTKLRSVSASTVGYVELPGVGHGFDLVDGARTGAVVAAIGRFLHQIHQDRPAAKTGAAV